MRQPVVVIAGGGFGREVLDVIEAENSVHHRWDVAVSGSVTIGARAMVGTHSTVLQGPTTGGGPTVGGTALVITDVPQGVVVKGAPVR